MDLLQTLSQLHEQLQKPLSRAAAEEIFGTARLIAAEYKDTTLHSEQEIDHQRRLHDNKLHRCAGW